MANCHLFPRCICLTIPEQRERQMLVVQEFEKVGIRNYEFFPGLLPDSTAVRNAYLQNCVKRYPDCFRCGKRDCGNPECNNILLPVQVAVALSFQAILRMVEKSEQLYVAICEDDIVFAGYAKKLFASDRFQHLIKSSGLPDDEPTLVRLTRPSIDKDKFFSEHVPADLCFTSEVVMSNPFFLVNRAFARLANERLNKIDHTADMIIHTAMLSQARCLTLNVQVVADRSWSLGEIPSLIHPKQHHVDYLRKHYGELEPRTLYETERVRKHIKKAVSRSFCFIGSPRCGSHFVSAFLQKNGIDVGHEALGNDGIVSWQYSVSSDKYPYISDHQATSDFFIHADNWFIYARNPITAIPSLIVENEKAPLSYAFRREKISEFFGIDLNEYTSPIEKAARAYAYWYMLALKRKPTAILRIENFLEDCQHYIDGYNFVAVDISGTERGAEKPYLGVRHRPSALPDEWRDSVSKDTFQVLRDVAKILGYDV